MSTQPTDESDAAKTLLTQAEKAAKQIRRESRVGWFSRWLEYRRTLAREKLCRKGKHVPREWKADGVTNVFARGTDRTNSLPIRREYNYVSTCKYCGIPLHHSISR